MRTKPNLIEKIIIYFLEKIGNVIDIIAKEEYKQRKIKNNN